MSTHNMCFHGDVRKNSIWVPLFSGAMIAMIDVDRI